MRSIVKLEVNVMLKADGGAGKTRKDESASEEHDQRLLIFELGIVYILGRCCIS
jgi:hypothetical protein